MIVLPSATRPDTHTPSSYYPILKKQPRPTNLLSLQMTALVMAAAIFFTSGAWTVADDLTELIDDMYTE